jgi:hypothetical protein
MARRLIWCAAPDCLRERGAWHNTIAPSTLERTARILARYIGPIAAVVVKKAAPAALDESDLYAKVAGRIADVDERARFVADLTEI